MVKALIIFFLSLAIFGTAAWFAYDLFIHPGQLERADIAEGPPSPPPDPSLPEFEKCRALQQDGKLDEAAPALENFLTNYPSSVKAEEAKELLGEVNTAQFFSPEPASGKQLYVVRKGDVLLKIATKTKSTPELISRANHLHGIVLHVGDELIIPQPELALEIHRAEKKVLLLNHAKFFKQYVPVAWHAPVSRNAAPINAKLLEKIAWRDGKRVGFGSREFDGSSRWITFSVPGYVLYSEPEPGQKGDKPPAGIGLRQDQMEELSALLSRRIPVTIR
jgi:LysM repeat protein